MTVEWQKSAAGGQAGMRASDADRERAVTVLRAGFAEGRLTGEEYEQRTGAALCALHQHELAALTDDLPHGPAAAPYPGPPPVPYGPPPPPLQPPPPTNGLATAALVCGVLTPVTCGLTAIPAIVLGHRAHSAMRRTGEQGEGQANAGLAIGYLAILAGLMLVALVAVLGNASDMMERHPMIVEEVPDPPAEP